MICTNNSKYLNHDVSYQHSTQGSSYMKCADDVHLAFCLSEIYLLVDVHSFTLTCTYNYHGLAPKSETLTDLYWTYGNDKGADKLVSFETNQNRLVVIQDSESSSLQISQKGD